MPVGGINGFSQQYGTSGISIKNDSASKMANDLYKVSQSEYGFKRGHQRQNAMDLRSAAKFNPGSVGNNVSRSSVTLVDKLGSGTKIKP